MDALFRSQLVALLPRLRRFARGLTGNADRADDLVQAACERALARMEQWTPGTRLDSWLFRIVRTIWIDDLRARKVRDRAHEREDLSDQVFDGERHIEARLTMEAVREAVSQLPEEQRETLLLIGVEGVSYKEAADILDIPIGTVMSRLARARAGLMRLMERRGRGGDDGKVVRLK
ncbi:MAG: RNA polymerase sigma factor [Alphaproteobacteria bacterium]|nr:RNA polymerase sigma factor [Alphaproteobacteria bacterium]